MISIISTPAGSIDFWGMASDHAIHIDGKVLMVELNHEVTPLVIRERMSSRKDEVELLLKTTLKEQVFILATCHRLTFLSYDVKSNRLIQLLMSLEPELNKNHLLCLEDDRAVRHWFAAACGLKSRTIGEHEVLGQFRQAYANSDHLAPEVSELVKRAIHTGKRARTETKIARYSTSLTSLTEHRITSVFQEVKTLKILIFGTGDMSRLVLQMLKRLAVRHIYIVSKDLARATKFCELPNSEALDYGQYHQVLSQVDVVIGATWTDHYLINDSDSQFHKNQLFIDLGMPRNFDPALGTVPGVQLSDLTDLNDSVATAKKKRDGQVYEVEQVIEQEVADFYNWLNFRSLIPEIRSLRAEVDDLRDRCCMRIHQELFYLSKTERKQLCYKIRGLTQQHFSKIIAILKSDLPVTGKVAAKLETLHALYYNVAELWHDFFAYSDDELPLVEILA